MKKKLTIKDLEVESFVTSAANKTVFGGVQTKEKVLCATLTNCNTCQCSEAYTICCPKTEQFDCTGPGF